MEEKVKKLQEVLTELNGIEACLRQMFETTYRRPGVDIEYTAAMVHINDLEEDIGYLIEKLVFM